MDIRIETITERVLRLLEAMDVEDILAEGGLTVEEALAILVREGYLEMPETEPL